MRFFSKMGVLFSEVTFEFVCSIISTLNPCKKKVKLAMVSIDKMEIKGKNILNSE